MVLTMAMTILVTKYFGSKQTVQLITFNIKMFLYFKNILKKIIILFLF